MSSGRGKADSPASSGPKRALDDRSVAEGRRQERRAREEDDWKAAASKVACEEGARTGGTFGRAGSFCSDTCYGKSTGACAARGMAAGDGPGRGCGARGRCNRVPASITGAGRDWFGRSGTDCACCRCRAEHAVDRTGTDRGASAERRATGSVHCCHSAGRE